MLTLLLSFIFTISPVAHKGTVPPGSVTSQADSTQANRVTIDKIFIVGNRKTQNKIILRELHIKAGEVYDERDLQDILLADKNKIINLRLFNSVEITTLNLSPNLIDVVIKVTERWYLFPAPIFSIVDRNLNDWWQNQNHDFSRTNYGVKVFQNNFRGRNEDLRVIFQLGYTKQFGLLYRIPYVDKSQRHGLSFGFNYAENKNVAYRTEGHKRIFFDSEKLLRLERSFELGYTFRNSFYAKHTANISFSSNTVNDTIVALNPNFYQPGEHIQRYFKITYSFLWDKRDIVAYPLHGNKFEILLHKYGVGIFNDLNQFDGTVMYTHFSDLKHGFFLANYSSLYFSGPAEQPYNSLGALGYKSDFVRGYELYLIEGQNYYLNRTTLKKRLFSTKGRLNFMPLEQFREFPLAIYIKTYFDIGYVKNLERYTETNVNTSLSNRYIFGTGFGLDIVTSYDTVIRLEYSFNREGSSGFFLHLKKEF